MSAEEKDFKGMLDDMKAQDEERFGFKAQCRQFLYQYSPEIEDEEFDEAMELMEGLGMIYHKTELEKVKEGDINRAIDKLDTPDTLDQYSYDKGFLKGVKWLLNKLKQ